jgi:hypothetical protein
VQELLTSLGPTSAGSQLLRKGITLQFDGFNQIKVPGITASASYAGFVGERQNIPVRQLPVSAGAILDPRKFATIVALTSEMLNSSNAEALVTAVLIDSVAIALDTALFSTTAGDATRPPGLLSGVTALTAVAGGSTNAMFADLGALAAAVAPFGGLDLAYIANPAEAVKMSFAMGAQFKLPVFASGGCPPKTVICIAVPALCSATDPAPRLESARDMEMHFDDTSPVDFGVPTRSLFQVDSVAIKLVMFVSWALRAPGVTAGNQTGSVAFVQNVSW